MSATPPPIPLMWDGEAFRPLERYVDLIGKHYAEGETYLMVEHQERSSISHRHYFACIRKAWGTLPEAMAERIPSPTHLRKYALIRAGYSNLREIVTDTEEAARKIAGFAHEIDPYSVITVKGCAVSIWTAKSQAEDKMDHKEFQASKEAVFHQIAKLIGVSPDQLQRNAQEAA